MTASMTAADIWPIVVLSMQVAIAAIVIALPAAVAVAYILAKWRFPGRGLLSAITIMPLVMPPVATGYALLLFLGPNGFGGRVLANWFGLEVGFRWTGAAVAAAIMAFPLIVRPLRLSFEAIDDRLLFAAKTLGASKAKIFATVVLPLALPGLLAGAILGFAKAMGEFGATITFVSNIPGETRTLSLAIYTLLQSPQGDRAALILIAVSVMISIAAVLLSEALSRRAARQIGQRDD